MSANTLALFTIRPVRHDELAVLDTPGRWKLYGRVLPFTRNVIVALDSHDAVVGYCAFDAEQRSRKIGRAIASKSVSPCGIRGIFLRGWRQFTGAGLA